MYRQAIRVIDYFDARSLQTLNCSVYITNSTVDSHQTNNDDSHCSPTPTCSSPSSCAAVVEHASSPLHDTVASATLDITTTLTPPLKPSSPSLPRPTTIESLASPSSTPTRTAETPALSQPATTGSNYRWQPQFECSTEAIAQYQAHRRLEMLVNVGHKAVNVNEIDLTTSEVSSVTSNTLEELPGMAWYHVQYLQASPYRCSICHAGVELVLRFHASASALPSLEEFRAIRSEYCKGKLPEPHTQATTNASAVQEQATTHSDCKVKTAPDQSPLQRDRQALDPPPAPMAGLNALQSGSRNVPPQRPSASVAVNEYLLAIGRSTLHHLSVCLVVSHY
jgi:hypothetical protein